MVSYGFHDLRHESVSSFFERGLNVVEVAIISGHRELRMLQRYTHLRAVDLLVKLEPAASNHSPIGGAFFTRSTPDCNRLKACGTRKLRCRADPPGSQPPRIASPVGRSPPRRPGTPLEQSDCSFLAPSAFVSGGCFARPRVGSIIARLTKSR